MSGSGVDEAIKTLLEALRAEGVTPIDDGFVGIIGLTPDQRLFLAALERVALVERGLETKILIVPPAQGPDVGPDTLIVVSGLEAGETEDPAPLGTEIQAETDSPPATVEDLPPAVEEPSGVFENNQPVTFGPNTVTADQVERDELGSAHSSHETVKSAKEVATIGGAEVAESQGMTAPLEAVEGVIPAGQTVAEPANVAQQAANLTVLTTLVEVPQPRSVPKMQERATTHGGAAVTPLEIVKKTVYLKNARLNEPYVAQVDVSGLQGICLIDDGGTGLRLDKEAGTLSGQPGMSGDFVVQVQGLLAGRRCDVLANLAVIPDPRSLWVSKPHDPIAPFAKGDEDSGMSRGDLLCVAASKRGRSHAQEGLFRDDDFALWTGGAAGWNIAVVADGAGSAKYSRRGSQIAVRTIVRDLPRLLDEHLTGQIDGLVADQLKGVEGADGRIRTQLYLSLATAAFNAAVAISNEATSVEDSVSAFSTTLVLSVARKGPHGWFIAGFSIGDGGAAVFDLPSRTVIPLTLADSGEFAGQTRFLQKSEFAVGYEEVVKRLFFDVRASFTAVLAMTDGITDPKFPTEIAFASSDVWCSFWEADLSQSVDLRPENPAIERELLAWLDFWSPGNHDDRTIAIMLP